MKVIGKNLRSFALGIIKVHFKYLDVISDISVLVMKEKFSMHLSMYSMLEYMWIIFI